MMKNERLKALPIPPLDEVRHQLSEEASVFLTLDEAKAFDLAKDTFFRDAGKLLYEKLIKDSDASKNWMADAWLSSYLEERQPILQSQNYAIQTASLFENNEEQIKVLAGWMIQLAATYQRLCASQSLVFTHDGRDYCRQTLLDIFHKRRVPNKQKDSLLTLAAPLTAITIQLRGGLYRIEVIDAQGRLAEKVQLEKQLRLLYKFTEEGTASDFFRLANLRGDETAEALQTYLLEEANQQHYQRLLNSLAIIHWMDAPFTGAECFAASVFSNNHHTLWPYMPLNLLFWGKGDMTWLFEHSQIDATAMRYLIEQTMSIEPVTSVQAAPVITTLNFTQPQAISSDLPSLKASSLDVDLGYQGYSMDFLAQLMFQYAQAHLEEDSRSIYAPCGMSHFQQGRTETLRSQSKESAFFIRQLKQGFWDEVALLEAAKVYRGRIKRAKTGAGYSRLLFMLERLSDQPFPFFSSSVLKKLNENYYSTSCLGEYKNSAQEFFFVPPPGAKIGIGYLIKGRQVHCSIMVKGADKAYLEQFMTHCLAFSKKLKHEGSLSAMSQSTTA